MFLGDPNLDMFIKTLLIRQEVEVLFKTDGICLDKTLSLGVVCLFLITSVCLSLIYKML